MSNIIFPYKAGTHLCGKYIQLSKAFVKSLFLVFSALSEYFYGHYKNLFTKVYIIISQFYLIFTKY